MVDVREITGEELEALVAEEKHVLIDFYFDNCGPCKMQKMILKDISKVVDDIAIVTMELSKNPTVAEKYEIGTVPYLIYFADGEIKERMIGMQQKAALLTLLNK